MRATVRGLHSPDADLETHVPRDPRDVGLLVQILAGPAGEIGEESFDVVVCTPRWLERWISEEGITVGRHHLIIDEWNFPQVKEYLVKAVESEEGRDWEELGHRIGRLGKWEFEDYQPFGTW